MKNEKRRHSNHRKGRKSANYSFPEGRGTFFIMAKSWSGFVAQNVVVKEQWSLLEATRAEIEERLDWLREHGSKEDQEDCALLLALEDAVEA